MPFTPAEIPALGPAVRTDEVIRPTRVVWRHPENRRVVTRVFPTEARAFDFASGLAGDIICVQDAHEQPPAQDADVNRRFVTFGSGRKTALLIEKRVRHLRRRSTTRTGMRPGPYAR